ncbi:MAG: transporter associated domain-containing protein, partial [Solirubrobacteraceae bacterium]|nr:transporter associated domain-containing protein [Solirubrobacteraceae bacterium]
PLQPLNDVYALANETGHSRFPVVPEGVDQVIGIVHVKHVVDVDPEDRERVSVSDIMVEPVVVPSSIELDDLLEMLREGRLQMAVVIDEFGGVDGVVTMEDLVEELVGDVVDEHDNADASARQEPDGTWDLSGLLRPDEVSEIVGVRLPEDEDYETLAGLLTLHLGRIPDEGDEVEFVIERFEHADVRVKLIAMAMHGLRVDRVHLELEEIPELDPDDEFEDDEHRRQDEHHRRDEHRRANGEDAR